MNKLLKYLSSLDWVLAIGTLLVGLFMKEAWVIGGGLLGVALAWYQPGVRIKAHLEKKFLAKKTETSDAQKSLAEDDFYRQVLGTASSAALVAEDSPPPRPASFAQVLPAGSFYLSPNRHSIVKYHHLNLAASADRRHWA